MTVPSGILVPGSYVEVNNSRAINPFGTEPFRVCIFGEHGVDPSTTDITPKYQRILSETDAYNKYGLSVSFEMCRSFFRTLPKGSNVELYVVSKPINVLNLSKSRIGVKTSDGNTYTAIGEDVVVDLVVNGIQQETQLLKTDTSFEVVTKIEELTNNNPLNSIKVISSFGILTSHTYVEWVSNTNTSSNITDQLKVLMGTSLSELLFDGVMRKTTTLVDNPIPYIITVSGTGTAADGDYYRDPTANETNSLGLYTHETEPNTYLLPEITTIGVLWKLYYNSETWNCITGGVVYYPPKTTWQTSLPSVHPLPVLVYTLPTPVSIDLDDYVSALPESVINAFINPYTDATNYGKLETEINRRFGSTVQLEGHQLITHSGTVSELETKMNSYNDFNLTVWDGGEERPTPDYQQSGALAGLMAGSLSEDPVVPMMSLLLTGLVAEAVEKRRGFDDLNALVGYGVAIGYANKQGELFTKRLTTSYTTTDGLSDVSYRDANTVFTTSYLRQSILRLLAFKYKNYKLADDGIRAKAGQKVATPKRITGTLLGWFVEMERRAIVENYDQFKSQLIVVRSTDDKTRIDVILPPDVVNQFRIFGGELQFIL